MWAPNRLRRFFEIRKILLHHCRIRRTIGVVKILVQACSYLREVALRLINLSQHEVDARLAMFPIEISRPQAALFRCSKIVKVQIGGGMVLVSNKIGERVHLQDPSAQRQYFVPRMFLHTEVSQTKIASRITSINNCRLRTSNTSFLWPLLLGK